MGWWVMDSAENPGLFGGFGSQSSMTTGDGPADIMGVALKEIIALYEAEWGRPPHKDELLGAFNFCLGGVEEQLTGYVEEEGAEDGDD